MTEATATKTIPVMPLRDVVLYPHMVSPLFVGREKSIQALDAAMKADPRRILVVAQKQAGYRRSQARRSLPFRHGGHHPAW